MQHKLAVIGYGWMGGWHHDLIDKVDSVTVVGVWDIREEARQKAVDRGARAYGSLEELLGDDEIEIVVVATPNNYHKEISIAALRAGKAVICEKPVAMNAAELREIMAAAKETGSFFSVHQNRRWDKDYQIVKKVLEAGSIGKPYFIESRVQGSRRSMHGWRGYKVNGGGMVLDWGVHLLDQVMMMIDSPVVSVGAHLFKVFTEEVEDNIKLFLRFENGVSAVLEMSTNCFIIHPRWHVSCTGGTLTVDKWGKEGQIICLREDAEKMEWTDDIIYTDAGPTRTMAPRPAHTTQELPLPTADAEWTDYYLNIADVLENGAEPMVKPEQALRVMEVIELIFEADRTGQTLACRI